MPMTPAESDTRRPASSPDASRLNLRAAVNYLSVIVLTLALAAYVGLRAFNSLQLEGNFTPDSIIYVNAAENIMHGAGYSRSMEELYPLIDRNGTLPVRETQWGPLYPIALALTSIFSRWRVDPAAAALAISAISLGPILLAVGFLVRRIVSLSSALLAAALLLHFEPLRMASSFAWSETLALAFMFVSFAFLVSSGSPKDDGALAGVAGLLAGFALTTRLALLPLPAVCGGYLLLRREPKPRVRDLAAFMGAWAFFAIPLILRNLRHSGSVGGAPWGSGRGTLAEGVSDTANGLLLSFRPANSMVAGIEVLLIIGAIAMCLMPRWRKRSAAPKIGEIQVSAFLTAWAIVYFAFLIVAQGRVRVDPIDLRLLLPGSAALFVALLILVSGRLPTWSCVVAAVALTIAALVPEISTARTIAKIGALPPWDSSRTVDRSETLTWLRDNVTRRDLLIAEDGLDLPFFLGPIDTAFFSHDRRPGRQLDYDETLGYLRETEAFNRYQTIFLMIHVRSEPEDAIREREGPFLADLAFERLNAYPGISLREIVDGELIFEWRDL